MNREEFIKEVLNLGLKLTNKQIDQFDCYLNYLTEYNKHTNLTTITEPEDVYLKHFYDSLTLISDESIDLNECTNLVDIGTGAGFPGMVLKIAYPHLHVTLIDSNNKKTKFLSELARKLELDNLEILNVRSEEYALSNLDKYDVVVSRAVANLRVLTELCLPLVKVEGLFIALKGNIENELNESKKIIKKLNGSITNINSFKLIKEDSVRNIIYIKKLAKTPNGYPRPYNKIKKD